MSKSRAKGTAWESACVNWLHDHGMPWVERRALAGAADKGDLLVPGLMVECKAEQRIDLAGYMKEVKAQVANCPEGTVGIAWVKARGKGVGDSYIVMTPATFLELWNS